MLKIGHTPDLTITHMLLGAVKAIHDGAPVPFTHILVDEYQDCSPAQTYLLAKLAELDGRHLIVFGDSYQGIYGFAGTKYTPLYSVLDDVQQLSMPVSWRLTSQTAAFASAIARLDEEHAIRTLRDGDMPVLLIDESEHKQAKRIVSDIRRLMDTGTPREQIAVLARTKALLHTVEQSLLASDIQTGRIGLMRHRKHPLRVLRLVRIVERCEAASKKVAPEMLSKVLSVINGVDDEQLKKQTLALDKVRRTPSLEGRYIHCAKIYLRLMGGVRSDKELRADVNRWEPFCRNHKDAKALRTAIMAIPSDKVVTATIHAAKGREWQHVFIVGVTDGLLPLYLAKDKQAISQERNTLYVAVTRAIDSVRLYHAPSVHSRSRQKFEKLSQFLRKSSVKETLKIGNGE
jgi:DNA helicase-2/ATP-dependent DNA helicase PcrA